MYYSFWKKVKFSNALLDLKRAYFVFVLISVFYIQERSIELKSREVYTLGGGTSEFELG